MMADRDGPAVNQNPNQNPNHNPNQNANQNPNQVPDDDNQGQNPPPI